MDRCRAVGLQQAKFFSGKRVEAVISVKLTGGFDVIKSMRAGFGVRVWNNKH